MTYTLVLIMLASGQVYQIQSGLALQECATKAAIERTIVLDMPEAKRPDVTFRCLPGMKISTHLKISSET